MKWREGFWGLCTYVIDATITVTANSLNIVGTLACQLGGALFSLSYTADEEINAAYFSSAVVNGRVDFSVNVTKLNYNIKNDTLFFNDNFNKTGGLSGNLQSYISPNSIIKACLILVGSGTLLKLSGTNLQYWQNTRLDKRLYQSQYQLPLSNAGLKEFSYVSLGAVFNSLADVFKIQTVTGTFIHFSKLFNSTLGFTYPERGNISHSTNYNGPIISVTVPLSYAFNENITISGGEMNVQASGVANALANISYGAGLFFSPNRHPEPPIAIPATLGLTSQLSGTFFTSKARQLREGRVHEAHNPAQVYEPLLSETDNTEVEGMQRMCQ